ncbi:MAG: hypothetical protein DRJ67_07160 [Thermoprotei archaeon]|nr:MAG: hypothetical protein DRJ67_07160 [Thermoprotei archaeon]
MIARPMRSPIAYVQARGRVLRWPTQDCRDCPKRRRMAALILHLAADHRESLMLEEDKVIANVESGNLGKLEARTGELWGYGEGVNELVAEVEVNLLKKVEKGFAHEGEYGREVTPPPHLIVEEGQKRRRVLRIKLDIKSYREEIAYIVADREGIYVNLIGGKSGRYTNVKQLEEILAEHIRDFLRRRGISREQHLFKELSEALKKVRTFASEELRKLANQRAQIDAIKCELRKYLQKQLSQGGVGSRSTRRLRRALQLLDEVQMSMRKQGGKQYIVVWYRGLRVASVSVQSPSKVMRKLCNVLLYNVLPLADTL